MLDLALARAWTRERAVLLPNWIDVDAIAPGEGGDYRAELGIPESAIVALYSGNMGGKQGLQTLADVARRLSLGVWLPCSAARGRGARRWRPSARACPASVSWTCSRPRGWANC